MEMTALQIFKYLPASKKAENSNCKKCGCPTCMAYALKLCKQKASPDDCPHLSDEFKKLYFNNMKHPQKTVKIGDNLIIGGENVLFRHEKTFINKTVLAVSVDCKNPDYKTKLKRICDFEIKGVNNKLKVDLIILKNADRSTDYDGNVSSITLEDYQKLEITNIEDTDFKSTKNYLITSRTKAILEKDDNYSNPVCVWMKGNNAREICARAGYYICKYANMIVFEDFNEAMFSTLLRLRENIYTNPQKPLQVESGLYEFQTPDKNSMCFLTTNFALTYFAVANELESAAKPSYLVVIPAEGMSVLTAWSAEKFTANIVAKTIDKFDIRNKMNTRRIIIPGLLAHVLEELKQTIPDFDFMVGTNEARDLKSFIKDYKTD